MKKGRIQGFLTGFLAACVLLISIPVFAESINVIFNPLNISINGEKVASKNTNFILDNGNEVPFSMVYKGTTYVPLKKLAEFTGKEVKLDPVTDTVDLKDINVAYDPKDEFSTVSPVNPDTQGQVLKHLTREQFARYLVSSLGLQDERGISTFYDVTEDNEYYNDIVVASAHGLMFGYNGRFAPKDIITRRQYAYTISKYIYKIDFNNYQPVSLSIVKDAVGYNDIVLREINAYLSLDLLQLSDDGKIKFNEPQIMDLTPDKKLKVIRQVLID